MTRLTCITERSYDAGSHGVSVWVSVIVAVTIHWMAAPVVVIAHKDEPLEITGRYTSGFG
jgi:hypothetical protein